MLFSKLCGCVWVDLVSPAQLLDSAGQSVDWNAYVAKTRGGGQETQRNGEAGGAAKYRLNEQGEEKSPVSTEDVGSFERSMKELEQAWQQARDNVRDQEEPAIA